MFCLVCACIKDSHPKTRQLRALQLHALGSVDRILPWRLHQHLDWSSLSEGLTKKDQNGCSMLHATVLNMKSISKQNRIKNNSNQCMAQPPTKNSATSGLTNFPRRVRASLHARLYASQKYTCVAKSLAQKKARDITNKTWHWAPGSRTSFG